jgi:hypothetical protein
MKEEIAIEKVSETWKVLVKKADNGFLLEWISDADDGESKVLHQKVIEEKNTEDGELEAMKDLLWEVKEYFGVYYSKHNNKNLNIEIEENKQDG